MKTLKFMDCAIERIILALKEQVSKVTPYESSCMIALADNIQFNSDQQPTSHAQTTNF